MKEIIEQFLNDENSRELKIPMMGINKYIELFKEFGYQQDDFETNGWQVDFWLYLSNDNKKLRLSGDLFYSETWLISKEEI